MRGAAWSLVLLVIAVSASLSEGRSPFAAFAASSQTEGYMRAMVKGGQRYGQCQGNVVLDASRQLSFSASAIASSTMGRFEGRLDASYNRACSRQYNRESDDSGDDECDIDSRNRVPAAEHRGQFRDQKNCEDADHCWPDSKNQWPLGANRDAVCYMKKTNTCSVPKRLRTYAETIHSKLNCKDGCWDDEAPAGERCYLSWDDVCRVCEKDRWYIFKEDGEEMDNREQCIWANGCWDSRAEGNKCYLKRNPCVTATRNCIVKELGPCDHEAGVGHMKAIWECGRIDDPNFGENEAVTVQVMKPCCQKDFVAESNPPNGPATVVGGPADTGKGPNSQANPSGNPNPDKPSPAGSGVGVGAGEDSGNSSPNNPAYPPSGNGAPGSPPSSGGGLTSAEDGVYYDNLPPRCSQVFPKCEENGALEHIADLKPDCMGKSADPLHILHGDNPDRHWMAHAEHMWNKRGVSRLQRGGCHGEGAGGRIGYVLFKVIPIVIRHFKEGGTLCNVQNVLEDMKCCILKRFVNVNKEGLGGVIRSISVHVQKRLEMHTGPGSVEFFTEEIVKCVENRFDEVEHLSWEYVDEIFQDLKESAADVGYYCPIDNDQNNGLGHVIRQVLPKVMEHMREGSSRCTMRRVLHDIKVTVMAECNFKEERVNYVFDAVVRHAREYYEEDEEQEFEDVVDRLTSVVSLRGEWEEDLDTDFEHCNTRHEFELQHEVEETSSRGRGGILGRIANRLGRYA